jgi:Fanconi-associated nuclease 1
MTLEAISRSSQNSTPVEQPLEPPAKRLKPTESPLSVEEDVQLPPEILGEIPEPPSFPAIEESEAVRKYDNQRKRSLGTGTYTSSIYVDAFNLALDTVLKEEAYLFSEEEAEIFAKYRSLDYEAQHL